MAKQDKLKTELILLCDYAVISQEGKLSTMGIFEEIRTTNPVAVLARGFLVATVSGAPNTSHGIRVKAEYVEDGESILPVMEMNITTGQNGKSNLVIELVGLNFTRGGEYTFTIFLGRDAVGSTSLSVVKVTPPETPEKLTN